MPENTDKIAPTVPARLMTIMAEMEAKYPADSFNLRLEFWSHCHTLEGNSTRNRTATYYLWSALHNFAVNHPDPAQLPRLLQEELDRRSVTDPVAIEEAEVALMGTEATPIETAA